MDQELSRIVLRKHEYYPQLSKIIPKDDLIKMLNNPCENGKAKPKVQMILESPPDLSTWLSTLEAKDSSIYQKVIKKIKACNDLLNFKGLMSEVEVLAFYLKKLGGQFEIIYEPSSIGGKKADILIRLKDKEIYFEITALMDDGKERELGSKSEHFSKTVESIPDNPFAVWFELPYEITPKEAEEFDKFIIEKIDSCKLKQGNFHFEFPISKKRIIRLNLERRELAGYSGHASDARILNDDERIRDKLRVEVEQVPNDKPVILIMDLTYSLMAQLIHFSDGVLGQKGYEIDRETGTSKPTRTNGFINQPEAKNITGVLGFKNGLENSRVVINSSSQFSLTTDELKLLMPENIFQPNQVK